MKSIKVLSALGLLVLASAAHAEVSGSMGIASSYLWRGIDLGSGTPAISGDLKVSASGLYAGVWGSSGDTVAGTEYDLYAGYGGSVGSFTYDVSYWTYAYPTKADIPPGDLAEVIGSVGFGPVSAFLNVGVSDLEDYEYYGIKAKFGPIGALLAKHDEGMAHVDLSYSYNDNLTFTVSKQVSKAPKKGEVLDENDNVIAYETDDPTFVVSYSVPFGK